MGFVQKEIQITAERKGFFLITRVIETKLPEINDFKIGTLHLFIKHTSAGLTINENFDSTVREDFEVSMNNLVKENEPFYKHTMEGPDDMPAHIKSSLMGFFLNIPISHGELNLGTWQGIYLCEFRNQGGERHIVATIYS